MTITTTAGGATSVYSADLDGDDDVDVLSASAGDNKIAWYEQTDDDMGNITLDFTKRVISATTVGASSVFAEDLNERRQRGRHRGLADSTGRSPGTRTSEAVTSDCPRRMERSSPPTHPGPPRCSPLTATETCRGHRHRRRRGGGFVRGRDHRRGRQGRPAPSATARRFPHSFPTLDTVLVSGVAIAPEALLAVDVGEDPGMDDGRHRGERRQRLDRVVRERRRR